MPEFKIEIIETLSKIVTVEAENLSEALENVKDRYYAEEWVLDSEDYLATEFGEYED